MRYFTRELWAEAQRSGDTEENNNRWNQAFGHYCRQLEVLRPRLLPVVFDFFASADIHDGELLDLRVVDGSRPAPVGEPTRRWSRSSQYPVRVELSIMDAYDKLIWEISYSNLRRVVIDYPSEAPLFYSSGEGFGDLGYHELTDAGGSYLRHEVLFATGALLLFEFQSVQVVSRPRAWNDAQTVVAGDVPPIAACL